MKHLHATGKTLPEAYHDALVQLQLNGDIIPCPAYNTNCKEIGMTFHVEEALAEPMVSKCFVGGQYELQQYVMEIQDGILDFMIGKGDTTWEYTYHDRMKDQIPFVIDMLKKDPNSRRAMINIRDNSVDMDIENEHPACLQNLAFFIRNGKLDMIATMRSNDAAQATFMNAFAFIIGIQKPIAEELGVEVGSYTHVAYSFHAYEKSWDMLDAYCKRIFDSFLENDDSEVTYNYQDFYKAAMEREIPGIMEMVQDQKDKYGIK